MTDASVDYTMTDYAVVDQTGAIQHYGRVPQFMVAMQPLASGQSVALGAGTAATSYGSNGVVVPRPANPTTISGMQLSNVPNPSTVTIAGGSPTTVTDGEVELSFTQPGTYDVQVSSWPMLDAVFSVTQS
jgi:hypothetical protein